MLTIFHALAIIVPALIFALMLIDIRNDLQMLSEIKALNPGEALTEEQRNWLAKQSANKL